MENLFRSRKSIFNPFVYIAGGEALLAGMAIIAATAVLAWLSNSWLDGMLDMHYGPKGPYWVHLAMGITNWLSAVIILTPLAMILSPSKVRPIDMAGTLALARLPMLIAVITGFIAAPKKLGEWAIYTFMEKGDPVTLVWSDILIAGLVMLVIVVMIVWMVALMYNAYKVSANINGNKAGISFTIGLIVAYIISKITAVYLIRNFLEG